MSNIDRLAYARAGNLFHAANVSAKSVIAVATAMTGVILHNPPGNKKRFAIVDVGFVWTTVPAAVHNLGIGIVAPENAAPTSLTAIGSGVQGPDGTGKGASSAFAYDAATFVVAPVARRWFGGAAWASGVAVGPYSLIDNVDGAILVPPGGSACLIAVTTTAVGMGHISWIEVD